MFINLLAQTTLLPHFVRWPCYFCLYISNIFFVWLLLNNSDFKTLQTDPNNILYGLMKINCKFKSTTLSQTKPQNTSVGLLLFWHRHNHHYHVFTLLPLDLFDALLTHCWRTVDTTAMPFSCSINTFVVWLLNTVVLLWQIISTSPSSQLGCIIFVG